MNKNYLLAEVLQQKIKAVRPIVDFRVEVYRGMTMEELAAQLDKSLKSTLKGTGYLFATKCIETGVDPYIAVAIVLHETGCDYGTCSSLVRNCYNVGESREVRVAAVLATFDMHH